MNIKSKIKSGISEKLPETAIIEIHGSNELIMSGCKNIREYTEELISISTDSGLFQIIGEKLSISVFRGDIFSVEGKINMLKFSGDI